MIKNKILHIFSPDKFTIPFIEFINKEFKQEEHLFLSCSDPDSDLLKVYSNIEFLSNPYRKNLFRNSRIFYINVRDASKIILHGIPILYFFSLTPAYLKKTYWVIQGYEFSDELLGSGKIKLRYFYIPWLLSQVYGHITHIQEDSDLANKLLKSSAKFFYSPGYISNIVDLNKSNFGLKSSTNKVTKILVGNSTSPTNNHISIFEMLMPYKNDNIVIYCPLSYGIYDQYKYKVIKTGRSLFGEKFVPLLDFLRVDEYMLFLKNIDIAIFNHNRQEAMGVTLQLLNMGKVVFMNPTTTSYRSFIKRGINVFDNNLIKEGQLFSKKDTSKNSKLLYNYYSYSKLIESWSKIFND